MRWDEKWWPNGPWDMHPGFFYMPQICDMGPIILLPFWRKACWGFLSPFKNPTASARFEPANLGIRGQHATSATPQPLLDEGNCQGLQPAPSTNGKARVASPVQSSKQDDDPHWLCDQLCRCLWRDCSQMSSSNCDVWTDHPCPVLCLFNANIPVSCSQRSTEANIQNLDTLCSEKTCDKIFVLPCHCHILQCTPSVCWWVRPRWSAPCWCWFDYSTHTCKVLSLSYETTDSLACQRVQEELTCKQVEWVAIIWGTSPNLWWYMVPQKCYVHEKLNLYITGWFWRGLMRQQQPSGSNLAHFNAHGNLCCIGTN